MDSSSSKKRFFRFLRVLLALSLLTYLVSCVSLVLWVATSPSCDEKSSAVAYARSLSAERLEKLYLDMEKYSVDANRERIIYRPMNDDWKIETPDEFKDLKVVRIRPYDGNIMVEGCFDHYVYMRFLGIGFLKKHHHHQGIELSWGEHTRAGKEMLWVKK